MMPDDKEDHTDELEVDAGNLRVDGPRENGTGGDEKDAETDAHVTPFAGCRPIRSGAGESTHGPGHRNLR